MIPTSQATRIRLVKVFGPKDHEEAERILINNCGSSIPLWIGKDEVGLERIRFAVLKLSGGDLGALRHSVNEANVDWRDVLVAAGFADSPDSYLSWNP